MVFDKMIMRLFVLRKGKADYRIAYGVFTPCLKVMSEPVISQASHKGGCVPPLTAKRRRKLSTAF